MRIASRYTLGVTVGAMLFFGAAGYVQLRSEERDLRAATRGSMQLLGRSLTVAFENALRDRQAEDVEETLRELERIDGTVDIFVLRGDGRVMASSAAAHPAPATHPSRMGAEFVSLHGVEWLQFQSRLTLRDGRQARLVVLRPLADLRADLRATRAGIAAAVAGFVAVVSVLGVVLGRVYVSRPLTGVIEAMRRVREGDLDPEPGPFATDEVGSARRELAVLVDALRETRANLELESERRRRLERGLDEVAKLVAIGRLSASVAHEIGSPLQVIEGRVASLAKRSSDPEVARVAEILLGQTQRITRIVEQLLAVARRRGDRRASVDLVVVLGPIIELLTHEARRMSATLSFDVERASVRAVADADQLQQVVFNLVRNALQASRPGGTIHVQLAIGVMGAAATPCVLLVVRDDGEGMPAFVLEHASDPFFTTRTDQGGTGLGLAIVRGLVDEHHGRLTIESVEGEGTVVTIQLPVERHPSALAEVQDVEAQ